MRIFFVLLLFCVFGHAVEPKSSSFTKLHGQNCKAKNISYSLTQNAKQLIILDAGHGGTDEGTKVLTVLEKKISLTTTLLAKQYLEDLGYKVKLTRARDIFLPLQKRVSIANESQASLFVSVHFNASKNKIAKGIEVFYPDAKELWRTHASKRLAHCVLSHLIRETEASSRGIKGGNFHVIRETQMPAVLIEGGFVTNGEERELLKNRDYLAKIAKGIASGVDKYLKT